MGGKPPTYNGNHLTNHTLFVTVNHPQFVAKWTKDALPYLELLRENNDDIWEKIEPFIKKHYDIIKQIKPEIKMLKL